MDEVAVNNAPEQYDSAGERNGVTGMRRSRITIIRQAYAVQEIIPLYL